ncbi:MAG: phage N-6-adenine-methyltransferase [Burkholderiales bacterium]|nr:phage N-6-adenine-methyltransferase [Burkholderiales bacterium]
MSSHHSAVAQRDEWLTPPHVLEALQPFDLDPCAPIVCPWPIAREHYTVMQDGLSQPWRGRVWLNPPYGPKTRLWMRRLAEHGDGIALIFARTETAIFFPWVWDHAAALLFLKGRLHFHYVDGRRAAANSGAPSVLVAYGRENRDRLAQSGLPGKLIDIRGAA